MIPALQGYLAATEEDLADSGELAEAGTQMLAVAELVETNNELSLALNDASIPVASRRAVVDQLLASRVLPAVARLAHQAVTVVPASELATSFRWLAARLATAAARDRSAPVPDEEVLGRQGSRNRVTGYAAAVFESVTVPELEEIEDQLFRFTRTVEADRRLRSALGDRDLPVALRQQVTASLLEGKALPASVRLVHYAVRGGRARDIVATLDALVEAAARARGWRVAQVRSAEDVDESRRGSLGDALTVLAGNPVDLQITVDPRLLGGVVVDLGDLRIDSSARHRLDELREHLLASEEAYRIPNRQPRREATDG